MPPVGLAVQPWLNTAQCTLSSISSGRWLLGVFEAILVCFKPPGEDLFVAGLDASFINTEMRQTNLLDREASSNTAATCTLE